MSFEEWKDQVAEIVYHDCGVTLDECLTHGIQVDGLYDDYESDPEDSAQEIANALVETETDESAYYWRDTDPVDGRSIR